MDYQDFIKRKSQIETNAGFSPVWMPDFLFDFQRHLVDWSIRKGRAALFADCGLGKTPMQLVWAENVVRKTNGRVLVLTPLAVAHQTVREAEKFGIEAVYSREGKNLGKITVANYERLHYFNADDFTGCVCDESSILKHYAGKTRTAIIDFMRPLPYRLLCTATPSPNDVTELGNSVEALGIRTRVQMLSEYFIHDSANTGDWRLKGHASEPFWRFVASWARAVRKPSDLGFHDGNFTVKPYRLRTHTIEGHVPEGELFPISAITRDEQLRELRDTVEMRADKVAELRHLSPKRPFVAWCSLNAESESIARRIDDAKELRGNMVDDEKEELILAFSRGEIRCLVTKAQMAGFGLNWQHCADTSFFPSHSHEQFYQALRRFHRFGQEREVNAHIVTTDSLSPIVENMKRKERQANELFQMVCRSMSKHYKEIRTEYEPTRKVELPSWM